jgi:hypothetical protein
MRLLDVQEIESLDLPSPQSIDISRFDLTKARRTTDGTMQMQYIATKMRIDVKWAYLPATTAQQILSFLETHKPFFKLEFEDADGTKKITVYVGDIKYTPYFKFGGVRYYETFTTSFIEV